MNELVLSLSFLAFKFGVTIAFRTLFIAELSLLHLNPRILKHQKSISSEFTQRDRQASDKSAHIFKFQVLGETIFIVEADGNEPYLHTLTS